MRSARLAATPGLGKGSPRTLRAKQNDDSSSDDSSDGGDQDSNEEADDNDSDDVNDDDIAPSRSYPFEFDNDGSMTGSDDEMDVDQANDNEFVKSMALADYHVTAGAHDSDDDDYAGVDQVSDDDDEHVNKTSKEVMRQAEKDLIAEFEETEHQDGLPRPQKERFEDSDDDEDLLGGVNLDVDPFGGSSFMDDQWAQLWETAELGIWRKPLQEADINEQSRSSRQKRVRFQESAPLTRVSSNESTSSSDEDEENTDFPDIFVEQNDPSVRHLLEESEPEWSGLAGNNSDLESVYDFEDDADRLAFEMDAESVSSEGDMSSDSEDDDGDETEDESVEEQQKKMQQFRKAMREAAISSTPSTPQATRPTSSQKSPGSIRLSPVLTRGGPRTGTFVCDPTKAILTTDKSTRKTILYPPARPSAEHKAFWDRARSAVKTQQGSPITIPAVAPPNAAELPFTAKATLSSMFDGRIDVFDEAAAPSLPPVMPIPQPNSIQPFPRFSPGIMSSFAVDNDASDMDAEYPAAFNTLLNMDEFDSSSSDTDMPSSSAMPVNGTPAFLAHGVVGSFRLNQHRARLESSLPSNPAKRASAAEHNALQSGRRAAGNTPITPARKRRSNSGDFSRTGSGVKKITSLALGSSPLVARRRHSRGQSLSGRLDQTLTPEMWKRF